MKTLNEEVIRIKSEIAEIVNKTFTGKTIQTQVEQMLAEIGSQKYDINEKRG